MHRDPCWSWGSLKGLEGKGWEKRKQKMAYHEFIFFALLSTPPFFILILIFFSFLDSRSCFPLRGIHGVAEATDQNRLMGM